MRINKYLAAAGVASRRDCDDLVEQGKVTINGRRAEIGQDVKDEDEVRLNGNPVKIKKNEYYMLNKPKGYICSVSDDKGRKTVLDLMPKGVGRIYPVGRLDYDSEGLLILTTDGALAQALTNPENEIPKTYIVKVEGTMTEADLNPIRSGVEITIADYVEKAPDGQKTQDGQKAQDGQTVRKPAEKAQAKTDRKPEKPQVRKYVTKKCKAHIIETNSAYTKVQITITEGKNREIRRMFAAIGKNVTLLKRIRIGDLAMRGLDRGAYRKLSQQEINYLHSL
ncbi:MAG: rRNA pseudouridine synthase [Clostridia bacterium]|nr:rRNA pseudouridine synthase [Clostridia bacterium]